MWAHHICISIILRKAILPCFPQYNCAHQNLKEKLCPELDGARSRPAPQPLRTQRLTPLAFATPCTQIYCENTGIRTLPYFQTATMSHACHVPYFQSATLSHACYVPYFQTCTLSHTCHVTELFNRELPVIMWAHTTSASALFCEKQSFLASPNRATHTKIWKKKLSPELDGARSRPAPQPLRTQRLTPLAFATPCTQIYCENTGIRTLPYFQTATLSHACHAPYFQIATLSHACMFLTFKLAHCPTPATWLTYSSVSYLWLCEPTPHLHQHYIAKSNPSLLPPI